MKDYKRLTEKSIGCFKYILKDHKPKAGEFNDYDAFYNYSMAVKILGELEDKIERGEIDYVADKDKEIARLTAENAELKKRLENAVELKAQVGDIIYMPWEYDGESDVATLKIEKIEWRDREFAYITDLTSDIYSYLAKYNYGIFYAIDFDYKVYTDRTKAEAKLKEYGVEVEE